MDNWGIVGLILVCASIWVIVKVLGYLRRTADAAERTAYAAERATAVAERAEADAYGLRGETTATLD